MYGKSSHVSGFMIKARPMYLVDGVREIGNNNNNNFGFWFC